jgi:glycosyltransferase involved in cell wall biosynthesis
VDLTPFILVVIPTYNRRSVLFRAIDSVLNQTYQNFKLIVVDDASDDGTFEEVLVQYQKEIRDKKMFLLKNETNLGVSASRNLAVRYDSEASWVAFLDSDDEWMEHKLQKQVDFLVGHPESQIIHGEEIWVRNGKRVNPKLKHAKSGGHIFKRCIDLCLISPSAVFIKKSFFNDCGGFNEDYPVCEDYDLWLTMTAKTSVGFVETPLLKKYGGHADQLSRKFPAMDYYRVLSLGRFLDGHSLEEETLQKLCQVIVKKSDILFVGNKKRGESKDFSKLIPVRERAQELLEI